MFLDRIEVDNKYSVLSVIPTATAVETLRWTTNIFRSANGTEIRRALAPYPAITITYNFDLQCGSDQRSLIESIATDQNEWVLPYFPHISLGEIDIGSYFPQKPFYPYHNYLAVFNQEGIVYRAMTSTGGAGYSIVLSSSSSTTADQITNSEEWWIVPCFVAQINPQVRYVDRGPNRADSTVSVTWRMSGESEEKMTYQVGEFNLLEKLQSPLEANVKRHQTSYAPAPAPAHVYSAHARAYDEATVTSARYLLDYDELNSDDYAFRGYWMSQLGSFSAGQYLFADKTHRLEDDMIVLNYQNGIINANANFREVSA